VIAAFISPHAAPAEAARRRHSIDYLGSLLMVAATVASCWR